MSEPFIGEIRLFGFNFAPRGWAKCDGSLIAISSNQALFSLLGTIYGGDGRVTFALPDLRGRFPRHAGAGAGITTIRVGQRGGKHVHTLTVGQLPAHAHQFAVPANSGSGDTDEPGGANPAADPASSATSVETRK